MTTPGGGIRLLYVPNEEGDFRQIGFRRPLHDLVESGLLDEVSIFSLQLRQRRSGHFSEEIGALIDRVDQFQPTIVLMQHLGSTRLTAGDFVRMRAKADFDLIYHEADPYSRFKHPLPRSARAAGKFADVVFTVGAGVFADNFRRAGAVDVRWAPHVFEPDRYPVKRIDDSPRRDFDFVMVANRNTPRFRGLPNWRDRIDFVEYMQDRFGSRFAVFGKGWSGPSALGPVEFGDQAKAARRGWITVNWDHYAKEPKYFSNRLPISLAAGTAHATCWHAGYDELFSRRDHPFLIFGKTFASLADALETFLSTNTPDDRLRIMQAAQNYAVQDCRQDDQLVAFLNWRERLIDPAAARAAWNVGNVPVDEV